MKHFDLFDAVRIVHFPGGFSAIPPYYSQTGTAQIKVGDIGMVIGEWPYDRYRVEAVNSEGAIVWQDHFDAAQLEMMPATAAAFNRIRIHEHWAYQIALGNELLDSKTRRESLKFARKVMAFARRNIEMLVERLESSGYRFTGDDGPWQPPEEDVSSCVEELAKQGVHVPVALEAWLIELGSVDFCGTHPQWPRTGYYVPDDDKSQQNHWLTDPLVIWFSAQSHLNWLKQVNVDEKEKRWLSIAPDVVHKANMSGGSPVSMNAESPSFDAPLVGQRGSFTLLSYLSWAFEWGGFPGFDYIPDAPKDMLRELRRGLTRL